MDGLPGRARAGSPLAATITLGAGFAALVVCLVGLGSLAEDVREREVNALDTLATPFLHGLASPGLDALMNAATFMGSSLAILPLFGVVFASLAWLHKPRHALFLAIACGGSLALNQAMKLFFDRPRPQLPWAQVLPDPSFPSGHTMNSVVFYGALAVILWSLRGRRTGVAAIVLAIPLALLIGVSRIYLGYHYFTDVVGGLLAGTAWLLVVAAAFGAGPLSRLRRRVTPPADDASS